MAVPRREVAHRLFAEEFNASNQQIEGEGEKDPSFVVSPLGAKVNRLHVVGVCTEVEPVGESGDVYRARISDPTGIFTVYAGQYQPEAAHTLSELQPPAFVAVTGKARTYQPEDGTVFVSIRPETVHVVDEPTRDQWVLDTGRRTKDRLDALEKLGALGAEATQEALEQGGLRTQVAEGAMLAEKHYGLVDPSRFRAAAVGALQGLLPGGEFTVHQRSGGDGGDASASTPAWTPPAKGEPAPSDEPDEEQEALDEQVVAVVQDLEGDDGAKWDDILDAAQKKEASLTAEDIEESLNRLMDKGLVYEPTLGVLRTT